MILLESGEMYLETKLILSKRSNEVHQIDICDEMGFLCVDELMDKWEAEGQFRDFICYDKLKPWRDFTGLRNELNYVITENSARLLGTIKKPMTIEDVYATKGQ